MTNPPPPQGQNPYGRPQGAAAPQGQNPFGQQPYGQPPVGGYPGGMPVPPAPPAQRGGALKKVLIGVAIVVTAGLAISGFIAGQDDANTAAKGDCVINRGSTIDPKVEVVDCGSSDAEFRVAEKHDGEGECNRNKYAEYSEMEGSDVLFTLCLEPVTN